MRTLEVGEKPVEGWVYRYIQISNDSEKSEPEYDITAICSSITISKDTDDYYRFDIISPNKGLRSWDLDSFVYYTQGDNYINTGTLYELGSPEDYPEYFI